MGDLLHTLALGLTAVALGGCARPDDPAESSAAQPIASATAAAAAPAPSDRPAAATPDAPCSPEMGLVGRVCIDRWEAHLVVAEDDGSIRVHPHSQRPQEGVRYQARTAPSVFPQAFISSIEAESACANAGKRLCTMVEWRRGCQGTRATTFMNARGAREDHCNTGKPHLLPLKFGNNPKLWKYEEHFNDPSLATEPGFLAKTGEHVDCGSTAGLYDMVGNLHEWVSDRVTERLVQKIEMDNVRRNDQPWTEGNGVFMGGFFSTTEELGPGCLFTTLAHEPSYHDYSTGFRCCKPAVLPAPARRDR